MLTKADKDADAQIQSRREAAQGELDGLQRRIAELQQREAAITHRVSELRAMFSQAFAGFGVPTPAQQDAPEASLPVETPVPEAGTAQDDEQLEQQDDDERSADDAQPATDESSAIDEESATDGQAESEE